MSGYGLFYARVVSVLSQPPKLRSDFEIQQFIPWFSKRSDLFRSVKSVLLHDVLKHCYFVKTERDDIIIKQGEKGDCFFIILCGRVTIYIHYAKSETLSARKETPKSSENSSGTPDTKAAEFNQVEDDRKCHDRHKIGTFVCHLGPGDTFGEVALLSGDCIRSASIVADESTDLIAVDRDLYNRSVKNFLAKEFEDKSNFVESSPYFSNWLPKYRKQLAMALRKESYDYDTAIARQGEPVSEIYFIISGEVKFTVNPYQHPSQFPEFLPKDTKRDSASDQSAPSHPERSCRVRKSVDLCLLGKNEIIGEIEILLDLDSYFHSSVCTQRTDVLVLEMKHYERLLVKRNPHTIDAMKKGLEFRLQHRFCKYLGRVPLLKSVLDKAANFDRGETFTVNEPYKQKSYNLNTDAFSLPPRGSLIDIFGPGTVFHRIREREKAKVKRMKFREKFNEQASTYLQRTQEVSSHDLSQKIISDDRDDKKTNLANRIIIGNESFYDLIGSNNESELTDLERRMQAWMGNGHSERLKKVAKTQRFPCITPDRLPKPARDVLRPRSHQQRELEQAVDKVASANSHS